ncbi:hypothetical protein NIES4102_03160 [Chondrocystis sp. NIES-4102]|nr:hypothetical protein NIES4102_03160 [Chondrocystis sp. NIES-4102]
MEDLLARLKAEFEPKSQSQAHRHKSPPPPNMEQMLSELRQELESSRGRISDDPQPIVNHQINRARLNALIDADYQQQANKREAQRALLQRQQEEKIAQEKRREQQLIEAQRREELRERNRTEALRQKAQQWLIQLNPRSEEGKWFEEFAYGYDSKLEAAVDYLEAMDETGL